MRRPAGGATGVLPSSFTRSGFRSPLNRPASIRTLLWPEAPVPVGVLIQQVLPSQCRTQPPLVSSDRLVPPHARSHPNSAMCVHTPVARSYAAAGCRCRAWLLRSGSYTSPVVHSLCNNTASFRATATMALFWALLPPRAANCNPHRLRSVSGPRSPPGPVCSAPPPRHQQGPQIAIAFLGDSQLRPASPDWLRLGRNPT